ncbi:MAG: RHS repeat-associated core domain-containing protein [Candidatus Sumerlaeia bacterium]|nr:RHS repeat-associated core domain-containing protein [Candidatus Sumerlaeia bacterium]
MRFTNAMTTEHLTLGPGVIGHIWRQRSTDVATYAATDRWFHYDQVGSVLSESGSAGTLAQRHEQDAFGNTVASWQSYTWGGGQPGWHHNSKEYDGELGLVYMYQRWYDGKLGAFVNANRYPIPLESRYAFAENQPVSALDPTGDIIFEIECYAGVGGKFCFGLNEDFSGGMIKIGFGAGYGGGFSVNPNAGSGDYTNGDGGLGAWGGAGVGFGPVSGGVGCEGVVTGEFDNMLAGETNCGVNDAYEVKGQLDWSCSASVGVQGVIPFGDPPPPSEQSANAKWAGCQARCKSSWGKPGDGLKFSSCMTQCME